MRVPLASLSRMLQRAPVHGIEVRRAAVPHHFQGVCQHPTAESFENTDLGDFTTRFTYDHAHMIPLAASEAADDACAKITWLVEKNDVPSLCVLEHLSKSCLVEGAAAIACQCAAPADVVDPMPSRAARVDFLAFILFLDVVP